MTSFQKLWESIHSDNEHENKALSVIRTGIGIRETFWEDFIKLLNNSESLAELLDVPVNNIGKWRTKIKEALEEVHMHDSDSKAKKNLKLIKTGLPKTNN
jgi:Trm5-related predicted tRNA methylase